MQVSVLVILYRGKDCITIHENGDQAWSELVRFVDAFWKDHPEKFDTPRPPSGELRVELFFAEPDASYILGNADVSQLEARVLAITQD